MLFTEVLFWIYLLFTLFLFYAIPRSWRSTFLLIISYLFYATWDIRFLSLMAMSTLADYFCGLYAYRYKSKRALYFSIIFNLSLLGIFKYFNFFLLQLGDLISVSPDSFFLSWGVPVGISFYTFQSISYTVDCYRRTLKPTKNIVLFSLYVSFFPQLLAGPIEKAHSLLPQLRNLPNARPLHIRRALFLILFGLYKKVYIADTLLHMIESYLHQEVIFFHEILFLGLITTFTVYFDFGAYSTIARGISYLFGIELVINFKPFFLSRNPTQFWRRWHISLTDWIRDYVFNPLLRQRFWRKRTYSLNYFIMILIGVWHGPKFNWLLWGICAGLFVAIFRIAKNSKIAKAAPLQLRTIASYSTMILMYIFLGNLHLLEDQNYRTLVASFQFAFASTESLLLSLQYLLPYLIPIFLYELISIKKESDYLFEELCPLKQSILAGYLIGAITFIENSSPSSFIYFQF